MRSLFSLKTEELIEELSSTSKNIFYDFKNIITYIANLESNVFFDWGSIVEGKGGSTQISHERALIIKDIIEKQEEENPDILCRTGKFEAIGIGKKKKNRRFVFKDLSNDEEYEGSISKSLVKELTSSKNQELEILQRVYSVEIEKRVKISDITQESKVTFELISLTQVQSN